MSSLSSATRIRVRRSIKQLTILSALASLMLATLPGLVGTALAITVTPWPTAPYYSLGTPHDPLATVSQTPEDEINNPTCAAIDPDASGEVKFEGRNLAGGTTLSSGDGLLEVKLVAVRVQDFGGRNYKFFDFETTTDSARDVSSVFVKQATGGAFFDYGLAPSDGDTYLHPQAWHPGDISHISFCYNPHAELTVIKNVVNDDGGTATASAFDLFVDGSEVTSGAGTSVAPGTYTISETIPAALSGQYEFVGIDCGAKGATSNAAFDVKVADGDDVTCIVTNDDVPGSLTLLKKVVNDDGGTAVVSDFAPTVSPPIGSPSFDAHDDATPTSHTVAAATYTLGETDVAGYTLTSIDCGSAGSDTTDPVTLDVTIGLDEHVTCTFTNDDDPGELILEKVIVDEDGLYPGAAEDDFEPTVTPSIGTPSWGANTVAAGTYTVGEQDAAGSSRLADGTFVNTSIVCDGANTTRVTVPNGGSKTCTITNTAVGAGLTVIKEVQNNWGGDLTALDFPLTVNGATVTTGVATSLPAGDYTIAEGQQPGYELVSSTCLRDDVPVPGISGKSFEISAAPGDTVVCTFVNRDVPATLTLHKTVVNDDGGTATEDHFTPSVDGHDTSWETPVDISAGDHTAAETALAGYVAGDWTGDCASDGSLTGAVLGGEYDCYITNDDQPATVVLRKTVVNDDGGTLTQDDFPAYVDGGLADWDDAVSIDAGVHSVSEKQQPGYAAGVWGGDCAADGTFTAELGGTYECTITNDDIAPTITLQKTVVNDDGGTLDEEDFPAYVDGNPLAWDTTIDIAAGAHIAAEGQQPGYTAGDWGGDCATDGTFTAKLDVDYVCTITNDDEPGELVLTKVVLNEAGGTATQQDFVPTIDGGDGDWGSNEVDAGTYTIDERDADGSSLLADGEYVQVSIECDGQSTDSITVANGETRECVITNQDVPAGLTVVKQVTNNWNGTLAPDDFPLTVNGNTVETGAFANFPAGDHTIAEEQQPGYELVDLTCVSDRSGDLEVAVGESVDISVTNNEAVVCTFENRDVPASLTVLKEVVNDDGGTASPDDFTPLVDDDETVWGSQNVTIGDQTGVPAGSYTVGELLADGYTLDSITCTDATSLGAGASTVEVELGLADEVTCTVVNDDIAPTVVFRKIVVNDDGGTATQDDFTPLFDGGEVAWDVTITTTAGSHEADEVAADGYLPGDWTGDCAADGSLVTEVGGSYECTITNDDLPAGLTVVKEVINDDGGSLGVGDFPLTVTPEGGDAVVVTSASESFVAAGTYTIGEEQQDGYTLTDIACSDGTSLADDGESVQVSVGLDERVLCTVTNDDLPIGILVVKSADQATVEFDPAEDAPVVTYEYLVTNTGDTTLTDVTLVDDVLGPITLPTTTLAPGQVVVGTATHTVTAGDAEAGSIVNVAVVTGTSPDGRTADDDDDEVVAIEEVGVAPEDVEQPRPAPAPAPVLPRTGADTMQLALWALLVAGLGLLFLLLSDDPVAEGARRRKR